MADPKPFREILLRWLLAIAAFALLLIFFSPPWGAFRLWSRVPELSDMLEVRRGAAVLQQMAQPGSPVADELHRVIQWRLFFPLIGHALGLPPMLLFAFAPAGCLLVLIYIVSLLRRQNVPWGETGLAAVALGSASWFFTSTGWLGYFDSWLALALLLVAFAEARGVVWLACLVAPWIDERFLIAAPLSLLCRWLQRPADFELKRDAGIPAALLAAFLVVRLGLLSGRSASGATLVGYLGSRPYLDAPVPRIALGVWEGLRGGWFFVVAALVFLWPQRRRALALGFALLGLMLVGLATAQDYSRSMTMLLPAAVLGTLLVRPGTARWWLPLLRAGAGLALVLPAHHVMNDAVNPIFNLQHELAVLEHPPAIAMPELYELRAIHAMERGEFARADADLALAIRLGPNPASPAKQRGILAASQGRWADARTYFLLLAEYDPNNPDAWFMCAQASHALAEPATARSQLDHALALAPADWKTRPDVARFIAKLRSPP